MIKYIICLLLILATESFANDQKKVPVKNIVKEKDEFVEEFEASKFLQIDKINLPAELEKIKAQINQNILDVILSTKTHTAVFAQKYEEGYTKKYKNFYGVDLTLVKSETPDYYDLEIFYYNWTTNKFDKKFRKKISVFNVLNETRFAMYETLLGSDFVKEHKDEIEAQNFNRIQTIRKNEELNLIKERNRKKEGLKNKLEKEKEKPELEEVAKLKRQEEIKKINQFIEEFKDDINSLKNQKNIAQSERNQNEIGGEDSETEKADEKEDSLVKRSPKKKDITKKKEAKISDASNQKTPSLDGQINKIKDDFKINDLSVLNSTRSKFSTLLNYHNESSKSNRLVTTDTYLRYLNIGIRYALESSIEESWFGEATLKTGMPLKKGKYKFPVYRNANILLGQNLFSYVSVIGGLNYAPLTFVNLKELGDGLKVFQNDIFWGQVGLRAKIDLFNRDIVFKILYAKSLMIENNFKKDYSGSSLGLNLFAEITKKMALEFTLEKRELTGDATVQNGSVGINYIYIF